MCALCDLEGNEVKKLEYDKQTWWLLIVLYMGWIAVIGYLAHEVGQWLR